MTTVDAIPAHGYLEGEELKSKTDIVEMSEEEAAELSLVALISRMEWRHVVDRIKESPEESRKQQMIEVDGIETMGHPLHLAVSKKPPKHVVDTLMEVYPDAIYAGDDKFGQLPLHLACIHTASAQVLQALVEGHEGSLRVTDKAHGRLPLHFACLHGSPYEILLLMSAEQRALIFKDADGKTPMDLAEESSNPHREVIVKRLKDQTRAITEAAQHQRKRQQQSLFPPPNQKSKRSPLRRAASQRGGLMSSSRQVLMTDEEKCLSKAVAFASHCYEMSLKKPSDALSGPMHVPSGVDQQRRRDSHSSESCSSGLTSEQRRSFRRASTSLDGSGVRKKSKSSTQKRNGLQKSSRNSFSEGSVALSRSMYDPETDQQRHRGSHSSENGSGGLTSEQRRSFRRASTSLDDSDFGKKSNSSSRKRNDLQKSSRNSSPEGSIALSRSMHDPETDQQRYHGSHSSKSSSSGLTSEQHRSFRRASTSLDDSNFGKKSNSSSRKSDDLQKSSRNLLGSIALSRSMYDPETDQQRHRGSHSSKSGSSGLTSEQHRSFHRSCKSLDNSDFGKKSNSSSRKRDGLRERFRNSFSEGSGALMTLNDGEEEDDVENTSKLNNAKEAWLLARLQAENEVDHSRPLQVEQLNLTTNSSRDNTKPRSDKLAMFLKVNAPDDNSYNDLEADYKSMGARSQPTLIPSSLTSKQTKLGKFAENKWIAKSMSSLFPKQKHVDFVESKQIVKSNKWDYSSDDDSDNYNRTPEMSRGSSSEDAARRGHSIGHTVQKSQELVSVKGRIGYLDVMRQALSQYCEVIYETIWKKEDDAQRSRETVIELQLQMQDLEERLQREQSALVLSESGIQLHKKTLAMHEIKIKGVDSEKSQLLEMLSKMEIAESVSKVVTTGE